MTQYKTSSIINIGEYPSSNLGLLWAASSDKGLWAVEFGIPKDQFVSRLSRKRKVKVNYNPEKVDHILRQLEEYLSGRRKSFDLVIDWSHMTDFQLAVRKATMGIPYGQTSTYGDIAVQAGKPGAARAVGRVQATNPISLVIPCHRVIGASGNLTGYGGPGGIKIKAWLLAFEKSHASGSLNKM
jgi:methylated-DNA-[protein]-cysteine S-methyltransferase